MLFEDLCFDAQLAAEKALKAVLVLGGRRFPKTHDLAELLHLVAATGLPYAVAGRYPGVSEDASLQDYEEALKTAEAVFAWAESLVGKSPRRAV